MKKDIEIIKSSGEKVRFSLSKLRNSLLRTGASSKVVQHILDKVRDELYLGISTKEIYNRAFSLLKKEQSVFASKYKLKKAIMELGPTGFPFEDFIAQLLKYSGYEIKIRQILKGKCVSHEVDVIATKSGKSVIIECKFHSLEGKNSDVKIPLYVHSRYNDIKSVWDDHNNETLEGVWIVNNTRFSDDAIQYAKCNSMQLLSWDYPEGDSLKERIDRLGLYPITVSNLLSSDEKQFLLDKQIVLCRQLMENNYFLDHLGISENRKTRIFKEIQQICNTSYFEKN